MIGFHANPGCVVPSIVTLSLRLGSDTTTGVIVLGPGGAMLKAIRSAPGLALAKAIAFRKLPAPESAVVVTVKVAAGDVNATPMDESGIPSSPASMRRQRAIRAAAFT